MHHHSESHCHHHAQTPQNGKAFVVAILLNTAFVIVEFIFGYFAHSTALIADAGHNLSDILGLLLAWGAHWLTQKKPTDRYTYGLRSSSILAALGNAMLLLIACGAIAWEALQRFSAPPAVDSLTLVWVASIGMMINGCSAWLFLREQTHDLNIRGAYLHLLADAAVSLGVVATGIIIYFTGYNWLDPTISLIIVTIIIMGTWKLLRESIQLAMSAVPAHIDPTEIANYLLSQPGVAGIHDLHIWGMSTTETALTVHLMMPQGHPGDVFLDHLDHQLRSQFKITHSTLQVEQGTTQHACALHQ